MQIPRVPLALEGYPFIALSAFIAVIFALLAWPIPALLFMALTCFITYFFRDPVRVAPGASNAIVCPADGKVILVREVEDSRFLQARVKKISIFMNVFNVHVNRIPISGAVKRVSHRPGRFYAADKEKAELHNEHCALILETSKGQCYAVVQVAGLIARRIVCWAQPGDQVLRAERYGLIRFGSRVDLYLPLEAEISVQEGQLVRAGETMLGALPHE